MTNAQGAVVVASYLDPDGMDLGATDPANAPHDPGQQPQPMAGAFGAFFPGSMGGSGSCIVDGTEIGCGFADVLMDLGAAQCPDNNCNPRMTKYGMLPLILMMNEGFGFFVRGKGEQKSHHAQNPSSQKSDCGAFVDRLISKIRTRLVAQQAVGRNMALWARDELHPKSQAGKLGFSTRENWRASMCIWVGNCWRCGIRTKGPIGYTKTRSPSQSG